MFLKLNFQYSFATLANKLRFEVLNVVTQFSSIPSFFSSFLLAHSKHVFIGQTREKLKNFLGASPPAPLSMGKVT